MTWLPFSYYAPGIVGGEFWSNGYYVATVGEKDDWSVVEKYIRNQGTAPMTV